MNNSKNKRILNFLHLLIACIVFFFLFTKIDFHSFIKTARTLTIGYCALALLLSIIGVLLSAFKWHILLKANQVYISYARAVQLYFIGGFFNCFLPTTIGGDLVKVLYLKKETNKFENALSATFMDRFSGIIGLATVLACGSIVNISFLQNNRIVLLPIFVLFVLLGSACIILFNRKLALRIKPLFFRLFPISNFFNARHHLDNLYNSLNQYRLKKNILCIAIALSLIFHILSIAGFYCMRLSVSMNAPLRYFFIFMPLILFLTMIPSSLHGIGLQEGLAYFFFVRVGASIEHIVVFSLLIHVIVFCVYSLGGIFYIFDRTKKLQLTT